MNNDKPKTNEKLKEEILTEFYLTGKVKGVYMKKFAKSKTNPLKHYIKMKLESYYHIFKEQQDYIDDIYQTLFVELWKINADKFVTEFAENTLKLCATACRIIVLKGLFRLYKTVTNKDGVKESMLQPKHSRMTDLLFASSFNNTNALINIIEVDDEEKNEHIFYDVDDEDLFFEQYGFAVEDITNALTPEELETFYGMLGNQKRSYKTEEIKKKRVALADKIRRLKPNNNKMNEQELFNTMIPLEAKFEAYKINKGGALTADEMEVMKKIYAGVQSVYPTVLPRIFNTGCGSCVISAFEQFILIWDRLKANYPLPEEGEDKQ